ncbi:MAG: NCS2 family permease [Gemmataceae bacterium]
MRAFLNRRFALEERGSTVPRELRGAVATFLTMAYILVINPDILAAAGVPRASAITCTAAAAGICCILMGFVANFPLALASGMGLNAIVAFQLAPRMGGWQAAMGLIILDGLVMLVLVFLGFREKMLDAIPRDMRRAIGAGIGLFIAFIGAVNAKLVIVPPGTLHELIQDPHKTLPPVTFGSLMQPEAAVAMIGLLVTALLVARRLRGAIVIGILFGTIVGACFGLVHWPSEFTAPSFAIVAQADVLAALKLSFVPLLLAVLMVDFFDTLGTVTGVAEQAKLTDEKGQIPQLREVLLVDSAAASIGGFMGVSSVTSYIESAAGVAEGARTGLHSIFVGLLMLLAIVAAPLLVIVPSAATAPALILIGFLMATHMAAIDFNQLETAIPSFLILVTLPFTYSIAHGIGFGFISYMAIMVLSGRFREVHWLMYVAALLFAAYFAWDPA